MTVLFALAHGVRALAHARARARLGCSSRSPREDQPSPLVELARARVHARAARRAALAAARRRVATLLAFAGSVGRRGRRWAASSSPSSTRARWSSAMVRLPSVSLEQSTEQARQVEKTLLELPRGHERRVPHGPRGDRRRPDGHEHDATSTSCSSPSASGRRPTTARASSRSSTRRSARACPGAGFAFTQPIEMNTNDLLAGISSDLALHLYGNDLAELRQTADHIVHTLRGIPGAKDVRAEQIAGMNTLTVTVDRQAIARARRRREGGAPTPSARSAGSTSARSSTARSATRSACASSEDARRDARVDRGSPGARRARQPRAARPARARSRWRPGPRRSAASGSSAASPSQLNVRGRDIGSFVEEAKGALDRDVKLPGRLLHRVGRGVRAAAVAPRSSSRSSSRSRSR